MPLIKSASKKAFQKNVETEMKAHPGRSSQNLAIAYAMKRKGKKMADGGDVSGAQSAQDSMRKAFGYADGGSPLDPRKSGQDSMRKAFKEPDENQEQQAKASPQETPSQEYEPLENKHYSKGGGVYNVSSPDKLLLEQEKPGFVPDEPQYDWIERPTNVLNVASRHEDDKDLNQRPVDMQASTSMSEQDLVDRIMEKRSQNFSGLARLSRGGKVANDTGTGQEADKLPNQMDDLVLRDDLESTYGDDDNSGDALGNAQEDEDRKDIVARIMASRRKKDRMPNPA